MTQSVFGQPRRITSQERLEITLKMKIEPNVVGKLSLNLLDEISCKFANESRRLNGMRDFVFREPAVYPTCAKPLTFPQNEVDVMNL